jgi:hypothetical protein
MQPFLFVIRILYWINKAINFVEMKQNFEERKLQYLEQVELAYNPPSQKTIWKKPVPVYNELWQYSRKCKGSDVIDEQIIIKRNQSWLFIPVFLFVTIAFNIIEWPNTSWFRALSSLIWFIILVVVVKLLGRLSGKKSLILIDTTGILFLSSNDSIKWHHLLRADIKELTENDLTTESVVLQAYDEKHDYFRAFEIDVTKLNVDIYELAHYIEHFNTQKLNSN